MSEPPKSDLQAPPAVANDVQVPDTPSGAEKRGQDLSAPGRLQASEAGRTLRARRRLSAAKVRKAKAALEALDGSRHISRRYRLGQALAKAEGEFVAAMGGPDTVSPQQAAICRMAARTMVLLHEVDAYILDSERGLGSPINRGKRALFPIVLQRQTLADALLRQLTALGLQRIAKDTKTLQQIAAEYQKSSSPPSVFAPQGATGSAPDGWPAAGGGDQP